MAIKDYIARLRLTRKPKKKNIIERLKLGMAVTDLSAEHVNEALDKFGAAMVDDPSLAKEYYAMVKNELMDRLNDERRRR